MRLLKLLFTTCSHPTTNGTTILSDTVIQAVCRCRHKDRKRVNGAEVPFNKREIKLTRKDTPIGE